MNISKTRDALKPPSSEGTRLSDGTRENDTSIPSLNFILSIVKKNFSPQPINLKLVP